MIHTFWKFSLVKLNFTQIWTNNKYVMSYFRLWWKRWGLWCLLRSWWLALLLWYGRFILHSKRIEFFSGTAFGLLRIILFLKNQKLRMMIVFSIRLIIKSGIFISGYFYVYVNAFVFSKSKSSPQRRLNSQFIYDWIY